MYIDYPYIQNITITIMINDYSSVIIIHLKYSGIFTTTTFTSSPLFQ